jgi:outer membrane protein TolC
MERNSPENQDLVLLAGVPDLTRADVDRLIGAALRSRSDLLQLQATLDLEHAQVSLEKAQFYPKLSLFSNYNVLAQQDGRLNFFGDPQNRTTTAAAGLQVEIPVFRGFARFARVQQAQSRVRQNETRLARAEQETLNQVRTLYDAVGEALARARSQRRAVDQAQRGYAIASAEYREGIGSQLQLTDSEVALRQAKYNYARAVYDHLSAKAQLELAIGMVPELAGEFPVSWERPNDQGDHDAR